MAPVASVPYARVPYATPPVSLDNLNADYDQKALRPLRDASAALRVHVVPGRGGSVRAEARHSVPHAGEGQSLSNRVVLGSGSGNAEDTSTSLATVARDARRQTVRETAGGDYARWGKEALLASGSTSTSALEAHAAHSLSLNDDLGPSLKTWTLQQVQGIVAKSGGAK